MASTARKQLIIEARVNEYMMRDDNPNVPWRADGIAEAADVVREVARLARTMGREVGTPDDTREMLAMV